MGSNKKSPRVPLPPLRTLDDFMLSSAKFQLPNLRSRERWFNRVRQNLIYYQTNYFLHFILCFFLYSFFHPLGVIIGAASLVTYYFAERIEIFGNIFLALLSRAIGYFILIYSLKSILVFAFGVLLPLAGIFIHASLRVRNISNKLYNQAEAASLTKSVVGEFFKSFKKEFKKQ